MDKFIQMQRMLTKCIQLWKYYFPCDRILAQRIAKSTANSTLAFIFVLIPQIRNRLGRLPSMLPLISVMVHPGRRVSGTIQGAIYCLIGQLFGLVYALFARFLAQRCIGSKWDKLTDLELYASHFQRYEAALAVLAVFETIMLLFHGWMRSVNHRYFGIVFPLFLVVHFAFLEPIKETAATITEAFTVPFYLGIAMSIFFNLTCFPEFGSTYLGNTTIDTLNELQKAVDHSINFFLSINLEENYHLYNKEPASLSRLLKYKNTIEKKVSTSELVYEECIYEVSYSYLSPNQLGPVIDSFDPLVMYIKGIINACQLEFILLGKQQNLEGDILKINTNKEIEFADADKLFAVLDKIRPLVYNLHKIISESMYTIKLVLANAYDVDIGRLHQCTMFKDDSFPMYDRKKDFPKDFCFAERIQQLQDALVEFDLGFRNELIKIDENLLNPTDEMFLLSSFLMNFKEVAGSVRTMMKTVKNIHEFRRTQESKGWLRGKTLWLNFLRNYDSLKIWLLANYSKASSVSENEGLKGTINTEHPSMFYPVNRPIVEEEELLAQKVTTNRSQKEKSITALPISNSDSTSSSTFQIIRKKKGILSMCSAMVTAFLLWCNNFYKKNTAHFRFALQVSIALLLASFPMFIPAARDWYNQYHGAWIGFVCILCMEPSVGGTFWVFFLRAVGIISGSAWAYLSYVAGVNQTNPYLETVVTVFGAVPGFYFLLGTPYIKAAIIQIISIYIVMLATIFPGDTPGGILVNFAKRCLAVAYGGGISLIVQVFVFPITARDQLNEEIAFVCGCISRMEFLYANNLEGEEITSSVNERRCMEFFKISASAKSALARAEAYKGLTRQEPRLKGAFTELENVFTQIIFLQRQIIDRMDNNSLLRKKYGSVTYDELNSILYPYRRQVVANISCSMRALQEAFLNKTPLPQFLPSARISHRRLINKVRQILRNRYMSRLNHLKPHATENKCDTFDQESIDSENSDERNIAMKSRNNKRVKQEALSPHEYVIKEKFLSWNASSAAVEEIIEYIEELMNLTKILVGVNEFKYGFLSRPLYTDWAAQAVTGFDDFLEGKKTKSNSHSPTAFENNSLIEESTEDQEQTEEVQDGNLNYSNESISSISIFNDGNEPVPYDIESDESNVGNYEASRLSRIASRTAGYAAKGLPSSFRKRVYSIGSADDYSAHLKSLSKKKTLGDADSAYFDDEDSSDEELPLALKRIMSKRRDK